MIQASHSAQNNASIYTNNKHNFSSIINNNNSNNNNKRIRAIRTIANVNKNMTVNNCNSSKKRTINISCEMPILS